MNQQHNKPGFFARPLKTRFEMRVRIAVLVVLAVGSVLAAYWGYPDVSMFLRGLLLGFGVLSLLRLYNTVNRR